MPALLGGHLMSREASGTAWQPEATPHAGLHALSRSWSMMAHGRLDLVFDAQGGSRGDRDVFSSNMMMGWATRPAGPGRLGVRLMVAAEPWTIGDEGYPLLLQAGETADGLTPLIDAQHPHDLFMELAATYAVSDATRSAFLYAGLPGEPALGPPAFMHRFSGAALPEAPLTHHWLDSTHITFGVLTGGVILDRWKLEASAFRGREPDERREDIEEPKLDSHSFRLSWNPGPAWALQVSHGRLRSPEQLEPEHDVDRTTASAMYHRAMRDGGWQTTFAWGRNDTPGEDALDGWLLETAASTGRHWVFGRAEWVERDDLFEENDPRGGEIFEVGKVGAGYALEVFRTEHLSGGPGVSANVSLVPSSLEDEYGSAPFSGMVFLRFTLQ